MVENFGKSSLSNWSQTSQTCDAVYLRQSWQASGWECVYKDGLVTDRPVKCRCILDVVAFYRLNNCSGDTCTTWSSLIYIINCWLFCPMPMFLSSNFKTRRFATHVDLNCKLISDLSLCVVDSLYCKFNKAQPQCNCSWLKERLKAVLSAVRCKYQ